MFRTIVMYERTNVIQSTLSKSDTFGTGLERCPSYRKSNRRSKERQGPTLGVRFTEVSVFIESQIKGVKKGRDQL